MREANKNGKEEQMPLLPKAELEAIRKRMEEWGTGRGPTLRDMRCLLADNEAMRLFVETWANEPCPLEEFHKAGVLCRTVFCQARRLLGR